MKFFVFLFQLYRKKTIIEIAILSDAYNSILNKKIADSEKKCYQ